MWKKKHLHIAVLPRALIYLSGSQTRIGMASSEQWGNFAPFLRVVFCCQQNLGMPQGVPSSYKTLSSPFLRVTFSLSSSILCLI